MTNEMNGITNGIVDNVNGIVSNVNGIVSNVNGIVSNVNGIVSNMNEMNGIVNITNGICMEYRLGSIPGFKCPLEGEISNFPSSKDEEIYLERMPYLINTDDLLEELLRK